MPKEQHAEFIKWMPFVLDALRQHGGSATPREVYDAVAELANVPDDKRFAKLDGGSLRFPNQVAWARQYLVWEELLASPKRGLWILTSAGQSKRLTYDDAQEIFRKWVAIHAARRQEGKTPSGTIASTPTPTPAAVIEATPESYKEEVLSHLQSVSSQEFERFCADLLRHLGMEEVEVTGCSGDKGIDGVGYLRVGPLVTTKVAFQCKRYSGAVSAHEVRGFQGAIGSRAEKGIFFTTGYFTDGARGAARDTMSKPIELIDGDRLVELLEQHEFGLRETTTYEVDYSFISNYQLDPKYRNAELSNPALQRTSAADTPAASMPQYLSTLPESGRATRQDR
jgi:restriction system protein